MPLFETKKSDHRAPDNLDKAKLPIAKKDDPLFFEILTGRGIASLDLLYRIGEGSEKRTMGAGSYGIHVKYFQKALNEWISQDLKTRGPLVPENGRFEYPTYQGVLRLQKITEVPGKGGFVGKNTIARLSNTSLGRLFELDLPIERKQISRNANEKEIYATIIDTIVKSEGGLCDIKGDKGGRTNMGVTAATLASMKTATLPKDTRLPEKVDDLTTDSIRPVYRNHWENAGCPYLPAGLAAMHFDAAINSGPTIAKRMLDSALAACGFDAKFETAKKLSAKEELAVIKKYSEIRGHHYDGLVRYGKDQKKFEAGWKNRLTEITGASIVLARQYR